MSFDHIPSKSEVMTWDPQTLAEFLRRQNLVGCDKAVLKCNMNGPRFLNMSDNDLQKFPKLHAPCINNRLGAQNTFSTVERVEEKDLRLAMKLIEKCQYHMKLSRLISKICQGINKKEEKRGFFHKRTTAAPKYQETVDVNHGQEGWDSEEFDSDDYESPDSNGEGEESGGDYESATEPGAESDDYEPPPSEPPDDIQHHQICAAKPMGNSEYIDRAHASVKSQQPPVPPARPGPGPGPPLPAPGRSSAGGSYQRTEQSPQRLQRPPPPDRSKKPSTLERSFNNAPSFQGASAAAPNDRGVLPPRSDTASQRNPGFDKFSEPPRMPKPALPTGGVRRSVSSVTPGQSQNRHLPDPRQEFRDDSNRHGSNTFPLHARNPSPRPPPHGHGGFPDGAQQTGSLPSRLQETMNSHRSSSRGPPQQPMRPPDPNAGGEQDMDPAWYMGKVTRNQAEGNLWRVNRDGAFLVRDSSKGTATQPYTLMVLYQDKVYNIQIRKTQNGFLLGTGLKSSESFPRVSDIINQHKQMPLLLIDAKNRGSGQQNQCALTHPAGY